MLPDQTYRRLPIRKTPQTHFHHYMRDYSSALDHGVAVRTGANPLDLDDVSGLTPSESVSNAAYLDSNKVLNVLQRPN